MIPAFPRLTQEIYDKKGKTLSGVFYCPENITFNLNSGKYKPWGECIVYLKNGVVHNESGPAIISKENGSLCSVAYFYDGKPHRDNGPAFIKYSKPVIWNGSQFETSSENEIKEYTYFENGIVHNLKGPAKYDMFGRIQKEFFINGHPIKMKDFKSNHKVVEYQKKQRLRAGMNKIFE